MKHKSLVTRIIFNITSIVLVFGFLATLFVYYYSSTNFLDSADTLIRVEASQHGKRIEKRVQFASEITKTISRQDFAKRVIVEGAKPDGSDIIHLKHYDIGGYYSAIYIMNNDGRVLLSTEPRFSDQNYSFRDYFKKGSSGESFVEVAVGVTSGELGYYISSPIINDQEVVGVVVTKLREKYIREVVGFESEGNMFLTDKNGVIIFSTRPDDVLKSLGPISANKQRDFRLERRYGNKQIESLGYSEIQAELDQVNQVETFELYSQGQTKNEILAVSPLEVGGFYLVLERDQADILGPAYKISLLLGSLVLLSVVFASSLVYRNIKKSLAPVKEIDRVAKRLSDGDLTSRVVYVGDDELGNISESINKMASSVERSSMELEKRVAERTKRLEKINKLLVGRELKMIEMKNKLNKLKDSNE